MVNLAFVVERGEDCIELVLYFVPFLFQSFQFRMLFLLAFVRYQSGCRTRTRACLLVGIVVAANQLLVLLLHSTEWQIVVSFLDIRALHGGHPV